MNRVPYVQSFGLAVPSELPWKNVLEAAHTGAKGTHLYMPPINMTPRSYDVAESFFRLAASPDTRINDPLGRLQPNGQVGRINQGDAELKYSGVTTPTRPARPLTPACDAWSSPIMTIVRRMRASATGASRSAAGRA